MNRQASPATPPASTPPRNNRRGLFLAALLLLLLLLLGGAFMAWRAWATTTSDPHKDKHRESAESETDTRKTCSDDGDPKYLEQLEFGPPIKPPFDSSLL